MGPSGFWLGQLCDGGAIELLVGWRKRAPKMEGALQQECLLWVPLCQARALSLVPSGSTAGLLSAVRGEIIIIKVRIFCPLPTYLQAIKFNLPGDKKNSHF